MSMTNISNPNQLSSCYQFMHCSQNNLENTAGTLKWIRSLYNKPNEHRILVPLNNYVNKGYSETVTPRICSLRSILFSENFFANPNVSDTCKQKRIQDIKNFFIEYFSLMEYVHSCDINHKNCPKPHLQSYMNLFFPKNVTPLPEVEALNWEMQFASEQNDKETFYKLWKECQSHLKGNPIQYEQRAKRFIFWSSLIGLVYTLFVSCIGCICYRRSQSKRFIDTFHRPQEISLDKENLKMETEPDNESKMSQQI